MSGFKAKWKVFWRIVRECFLRSLTPWLMYFVASIVMLTVYSREMSLGAQMAWAVICAVVAIAYNGLLMWVCGGTHYEMLVSGNMKRRSAMQTGGELNITSYKFEKEYRPWKGFVIGAFVALLPIIGCIAFGCNQEELVRFAQADDGEGVEPRSGDHVPHLLFSRGVDRPAPARTQRHGHGDQLFRRLRVLRDPRPRFGRTVYRGRVRAAE